MTNEHTFAPMCRILVLGTYCRAEHPHTILIGHGLTSTAPLQIKMGAPGDEVEATISAEQHEKLVRLLGSRPVEEADLACTLRALQIEDAPRWASFVACICA